MKEARGGTDLEVLSHPLIILIWIRVGQEHFKYHQRNGGIDSRCHNITRDAMASKNDNKSFPSSQDLHWQEPQSLGVWDDIQDPGPCLHQTGHEAQCPAQLAEDPGLSGHEQEQVKLHWDLLLLRSDHWPPLCDTPPSPWYFEEETRMKISRHLR